MRYLDRASSTARGSSWLLTTLATLSGFHFLADRLTPARIEDKHSGIFPLITPEAQRLQIAKVVSAAPTFGPNMVNGERIGLITSVSAGKTLPVSTEYPGPFALRDHGASYLFRPLMIWTTRARVRPTSRAMFP
jgi:hypothetical protein